jgi:uncharacterized SAM-binding protein YcdF (DUF218 family)
MFYFFAKVLSFMLRPYTWLTLLLLAYIFSANLKLRRVFFAGFVFVFFFFSNTVLSTFLMAKWEYPARDLPQGQQYQYGVMLGGVAGYDSHADRVEFNSSSDRFLQTIKLYESGVIKKIILSGGEGTLVKEGKLESILLRDYLIRLGIPETDIIVEPYSQNTNENAVQTALLLNRLEYSGKCVLITSAYHLRRAEACFKKQGVDVVAYSVDRYVFEDRTYRINDYLLPNSESLELWKVLIHEVVGYFMYYLMGYV